MCGIWVNLVCDGAVRGREWVIFMGFVLKMVGIWVKWVGIWVKMVWIWVKMGEMCENVVNFRGVWCKYIRVGAGDYA